MSSIQEKNDVFKKLSNLEVQIFSTANCPVSEDPQKHPQWYEYICLHKQANHYYGSEDKVVAVLITKGFTHVPGEGFISCYYGEILRVYHKTDDFISLVTISKDRELFAQVPIV